MSTTSEFLIAAAATQLQLGDLEGAERLCREAIAEPSSTDASAYTLLARVLRLGRRNDEARFCVERALMLDADLVPALFEDAALAQADGRLDRTEECLRRIVAQAPGNATLVYDLARVQLERGRNAEARDNLSRVLTLDPNHVDARLYLAESEATLGNHAAALTSFRVLTVRHPGVARVWQGLGASALALGDLQSAAEGYGRALGLDDRSPQALAGFADVAQRAGDTAGAKRAIRRLIEVSDGSADAWFRLAVVHLLDDEFAEASAALDRALMRDPGLRPAQWLRGHVPPSLVFDDAQAANAFVQRWQDTIASFETLDPASPEVRATAEQAMILANNFYLPYLVEAVAPMQRRAGALLRRVAAAILPDPVLAQRAPGARSRIVFVSSFFRSHSVMKLFERVIAGLDRERFQVILCYVGDRRDAVTERLAASVDQMLIGVRSVATWRRVILEQRPDVLVHVDVGMDPHTQWLAAERLAPVQCALWGHPVTTGLETIDYFLTADAMEREAGEADYSERVLRLPNLGLCTLPPDTTPDAAFTAPGRRAADSIHYIQPQQVWKLQPQHDALLARIAAQVPQAQFSFTPHKSEGVRAQLSARLRRAFTAQQQQADGRVHVLPHLSSAEYLALAQSADINLDTIGWSGGITSLEILWFDVPTVTLPRDSMRSRHTHGMLKLMELDELIAKDEDDYVRIAVALGQSADLRGAVRAKIAARKHRLYDDRNVVDALGKYLQQIAPR